MEGNLRVWDHLDGDRNSFPKIKKDQIGSPDLKKMAQMCAGSAPVRLHPSLYRVLKLSYPTDSSSSVLDVQIMTDIGTGSLGQSVRVLAPQISAQSVFKGS